MTTTRTGLRYVGSISALHGPVLSATPCECGQCSRPGADRALDIVVRSRHGKQSLTHVQTVSVVAA